MRKIQKKENGITLIALVITIIVLLILAGVSIAMLTGQNGILAQAQKASEQTEIASEEEKVKLSSVAALARDNGQEIIQTNLEEELEKYFNISDFSVTTGTNESGENGFIVTVTENVEEGRKYFVSEKGVVEQYTESQVSGLTDIYVSLYTDGTLVFSNNDQPIEGKTLEKSYGNIKDKVFDINQDGEWELPNVPWFELENISSEEELLSQISKVTKIDITTKIVPKNTSVWFAYLMNLQEIDGLENLDTSNVTNMCGMFLGCGLTSIDLSSFNTSNVTDMSGMFNECSGLTSLNLSSFNTSNVTNMSGMFYGCSGLTSLNLSSFNTSNVTDMSGMFTKCSGLTSLNLSSFNTYNVTDMSWMFYGCSGLTSLNLSNFNTSNVTDMGMMFDGCERLTSLNLSNFYTSNVTTMQQMFSGCKNLVSLDISSFDISENININYFILEVKDTCTIYVKNQETIDLLKASDFRNTNKNFQVKS